MIAVDIVLLPPKAVMERVIEINKKIIEAGDSAIILNEERCIPHITLAMGCVKEEDLPKVEKILSDVASNFPELTLETLYQKGGPASLKLEKTRDIELLHEIVMIRLSPLMSYKVDKDMVLGGDAEDFHELTIEYIHKFAPRGSFENYLPHITLGLGQTDIELEQFSFTANTLALCHLGDLCTCRKILFSQKLIGRN